MPDPIHIISLGAGVQSSTMALMAAKGEITPMPTCAIFADTQAEPASVYKWLDWLEKQLPFPVYRVTAGKLEEHLTRVYFSDKNKKMTCAGLPAFVLNPDGTQGLMSRQCTTDYKIAPIDKAFTKIMREHNVKHSIKWIGISLDESLRMKDSKRSTVAHRYPLIDLRMNRHDCLIWMQRNNYPKPPRSACIFCPYKSNEEWKSLPSTEFEHAVKFELKLQEVHRNSSLISKPFLHRSMVPLNQVDFSTDIERGQLSLFENDCTGLCGV